MSRPAVFIDRDGTLIEERHYPVVREDIVPLRGAAAALARLSSAGFLCVVLTNQSAVARGMIDEESLGELHDDLLMRLRDEGGGWDALYYCPHHPDGTSVGYGMPCTCRKPGHGLLEMALHEHDIDLARSVFVGDRTRDLYIDAGRALGRVLVQSGDETYARAPEGVDVVVPSVVEAVDWILERLPEELAAPDAESATPDTHSGTEAETGPADAAPDPADDDAAT